MKLKLLLLSVLFPLIGFSQSTETLRKQALHFFDEGRIKEALASFEKIQDKETLEITNVNLWKEHIVDIQNLKFIPNQSYNKKAEIVNIKTGLLEHYGVYDGIAKQFIIQPVYDKIEPMDGYVNGFLIYKGNKIGLCNAEGRFVIPLGNHTIQSRPYSRLINTKQFSNSQSSSELQSAIYDFNGKLLLDNAEIIYDYNLDSLIIIKNNKNIFQLYDIKKNEIVLDNCSEIKSPWFDYSTYFDFVLVRKDNQSFFYHIKTNMLEPNPDFETVIDMNSEDQQRVSYILNLKNGITEEKNYEKYFFVKKNNKTGIYNLKQRKYLFPVIYDSISPLLNCLYKNEWKNLIYDEPVTEVLGYSIEGLKNNLAFFVFSKSGKYGVKNLYGGKRLEAEYDEIDLSSHILIFRKGKKWGFLGRNKKVVKPKFDYVEGDGNNVKVFFSGNAYVYKYNNTKKKYYITKPEKDKYDLERQAERKEDLKRKDPNFIEYSDFDFDEDLKIKRKRIKKGNLYGIAGLMRNEIIPPIYKEIRLDGDKFVIQTTDKYSGLLDKNGKVLIPLIYGGVNHLRNNLYKVYDELKNGVFDIAVQKEIIPPVYKAIQAINDDLFLAMNDEDLFGIIDKENKIIYPFVIQPYGLTNLRLSSNDFIVLSGFKDVAFSVSSLIRITNGKAVDIFDNKVLSNCFLGYSKRFLRIKENDTFRFYDLSKAEFLEEQFKESIYVPNGGRYLLKKDQLFEYQIYMSEDITKRTNAIVADWDGYSLYEENNKMGLINKTGEKSKATFPKILFLDYVPRPKTLFKYYLNTTSERNGLIDFEGNSIVEAEKYDEIRPISNSYIGLSFPNKEFTVEEISYIFECTDKSNAEYDSIDFISLSGRKMGTQKIEKGYKRFDMQNQKGILFYKSNEAVQLFDLKEGKTILKTKSIAIDGDYTRNIFTSLYYTDDKSGKKERRVQLINSTGTIVADEKYDAEDERIERKRYGANIKTWANPLITFRENKFGLVNFDNQTLYPFVCDTISYAADRTWNYNYGFMEAVKNDKKGILDYKGRILLDIIYDQLEWVNLFENKEERDDQRRLSAKTFNIIVKEKDKYGLLNSQLNPILETDFDEIQIGSKTIKSPIVARKEGYSIVFDSKGHYQFKVQCDSLRENYKSDYFEIFKEGKQGILDTNGNLIFDYKYPNVRKIEIDNLFIIQKDNNEYLIDDKGEIISDGFKEINTLEYNDKENYKSKHYAILTKNQDNKAGMLDQKGNVTIPNEYYSITEISDSKYIHVIKEGKYGILDFNKNIVLPFNYTSRIYYEYSNKIFDCDTDDVEFRITPRNIVIEEKYKR